MLVTIIADASVDPVHRVGGYGFWIVSQRGRYAGEGAFKDPVSHSQVAEMMAVMNALHTALAKFIAYPGDQFLVQTDCFTAITRFTHQTRRDATDAVALIVQAFEQFLSTNQVTVKFRHIKAHTNQTDPRFLAQRHSDIRARRAMRQARREKLKETT